MYRDPSKLRAHVVKVRLSVAEDRLLEALADYTGEQKAVLIRDLVLSQARAVLQSDAPDQAVEGTSLGLVRA